MAGVTHVCLSDYPELADYFTAGESIKFSFSKREKAAQKVEKFIKPSAWIPRHVRIIRGEFASKNAFFSYEITPHWRDIHDIAAEGCIRKLVITGAAQGTGKTTGVDAWMAWSHKYMKGPSLSFYPDEVTAKRAGERIRQLVEADPSLMKLVEPGRHAITDYKVELIGGDWETGWAGSLSQTSDRSVMKVDKQEVDKPVYGKSTAEASPYALCDLRARSYPTSYKIWETSSCSTVNGNIWQAILNECEAVFYMWVPCAHCGQEIAMYFDETEERFYAPRQTDFEGEILRDDEGRELFVDRLTVKSKGLGRYICQECGGLIDDADRNRMIRKATWRKVEFDDRGQVDFNAPKGEELHHYVRTKRPGAVGFIHPAWYSWFVSISEAVSELLKSRDTTLPENERMSARKNLYNGFCSLPWIPEVESRKHDELMRLRNPNRPESIVPMNEGIVGLWAGCDTQGVGRGFWFWIHARGAGLNPKRWVIAAGFVQDFDAVRKVILENEYLNETGQAYQVYRALQDAMGHRTAEVYDFCSTSHGRIVPSNGLRSMGTPYDLKPQEFYPGTEKKKLPYALKRVNWNNTFYKDKADAILKTGAGLPGSLELPADFPENYVKQLCAETRGDDGYWVNEMNRDEHLWDCFCQALVAEDIDRAKDWPNPDDVQVIVQPRKKKKKIETGGRW